jgi:hypothetical protein
MVDLGMEFQDQKHCSFNSSGLVSGFSGLSFHTHKDHSSTPLHGSCLIFLRLSTLRGGTLVCGHAGLFGSSRAMPRCSSVRDGHFGQTCAGQVGQKGVLKINFT